MLTTDLLEKARRDAKSDNASIAEEASKAREDYDTIAQRCAVSGSPC